MSKDLFKNEDEQKVHEAHERMRVHVAKYESFEEFVLYFESVTTGKDADMVKQWLLLVLHHNLKLRGFEELLSLVDESKREDLKQWLNQSILKAKKGV